MYLLDTNIWLERLLNQENSAVVGELLTTLSPTEICMTDFTLHSIGVICDRLKQIEIFQQFVQDVVIDGNVQIVSVPLDTLGDVVKAIDQFNVDFDDAYQLVAARNIPASIVSFDRDFDKTDLGRLTPAQILEEIRSF